MPRIRVEDRQGDFRAGLVYDASQFYSGIAYDAPNRAALPPNGLLQARFCRITADGGLQKLHGTRRLHASALDGGADIVGGFSWRKGDGTVQQLATTDQLFTGTYALGMTWTGQTGALDPLIYHDFAAFRDGSGECVFIADGGLLNKWDGSAVAANISGTTSVRRLAVYNQRLFGINGTDQTLYWSALNNGDSLGNTGSGGGSAIIRTFGGQNLTALAVVGGSLLIFHANAISRFTGYTQDDIDIDAGVVGRAEGVGTLAPRSVVVVSIDGRDVALFLTKQGLYAASETDVVPIPTPFARELGFLGGTAGWSHVHAVHNPDNREVWFSLPSAGVYIYRYDHKAWTGPHGGLFIGSTATLSMWTGETNLGGRVILSGGADGFVRHYDYPDTALHDVLSDGSNGSAATMLAECVPWFFGDEATEKTLRHLYLTAHAVGGVVSPSPTVQWTTSTGDGSAVTFVPPLAYGVVAVPWWGRGTYVGVTIVDQGDRPTLYGPLRGEAFMLARRRGS